MTNFDQDQDDQTPPSTAPTDPNAPTDSNANADDGQAVQQPVATDPSAPAADTSQGGANQSSAGVGTGAAAGTPAAPNIVFAPFGPPTGGTVGPINTSLEIIHDNDTFDVQWAARNLGPGDAAAFTDLLVVTSIPEGCPGSDDQNYTVVFNSSSAGNPQDYMEGPLVAGATGPIMHPTVGPFATGSYRFTVTLAQGVSNTTTFICKEIIAH